jgi:hypothetical protein
MIWPRWPLKVSALMASVPSGVLELAVRVDQQARAQGQVAGIGRDATGCVIQRAVRLTDRDVGVAATALNQCAVVVVQVRYVQGQLASRRVPFPLSSFWPATVFAVTLSLPAVFTLAFRVIAAAGGDGDIRSATLAAI